MPSGGGTKQAISSWVLKSQLQVQLVRKVEGCSKEKGVLHNRAPVLYDYDFRLANLPFFFLPSFPSLLFPPLLPCSLFWVYYWLPLLVCFFFPYYL